MVLGWVPGTECAGEGIHRSSGRGNAAANPDYRRAPEGPQAARRAVGTGPESPSGPRGEVRTALPHALGGPVPGHSRPPASGLAGGPEVTPSDGTD